MTVASELADLLERVKAGEPGALAEYQRRCEELTEAYRAAFRATPDVDVSRVRAEVAPRTGDIVAEFQRAASELARQSPSGDGLDFQIIIDDYVPRAFYGIGASGGRYSALVRHDGEAGLYDHGERRVLETSDREKVLLWEIIGLRRASRA